MSTTKAIQVWSDPPRRRGFEWIYGNLSRMGHQVRIAILAHFVSFIGRISTPGMKLFGHLQAWGLRAMGVKCASHEIWIGPRTYFVYPEHITLGRRIVIGEHSCLIALNGIAIGDDFLSAPGLYLNTGTHDPVTLVPQTSPIEIGPGVWCGQRVTVCSGVTVGEGAVIGAGAVVVKDLPEWHICVGVPCKPVRAFNPPRPGTRWTNFRHS